MYENDISGTLDFENFPGPPSLDVSRAFGTRNYPSPPTFYTLPFYTAMYSLLPQSFAYRKHFNLNPVNSLSLSLYIWNASSQS